MEVDGAVVVDDVRVMPEAFAQCATETTRLLLTTFAPNATQEQLDASIYGHHYLKKKQ
eukprot:gene8765-5715_t